MRKTITYVCSAGHLVKAENSAINIDSLCGRCKRRNLLAARGMRPVAELAAARPHGDRLRYIAGCRCDECRSANTAYEKGRRAARKAGDWNGIVPADEARAHLRRLSREGVGRRSVSECADISETVLAEIRSGRKHRIRARTERKILTVTKAQRADRALVSAGRTWQLLEELLEEGYTRPQLLRRLGYRCKGFQLGRERVTVRNAARVERLHRELTT